MVQLESVRPPPEEQGATEPARLRSVDLNGDSLPDYFGELFELQDEERGEYFQLCNNLGGCLFEAWVGCDDLLALVLPPTESRETSLVPPAREVGGFEWRAIQTTERVGGVAEEELEDPFITRTWRIADDFKYQLESSAGEYFAPASTSPAAPAEDESFIRIHAAWGSGPDDIFAVGNGVLHFDGQQWSPMEISLDGRPLVAVWGAQSNDVFAATPTKVFHFDGDDWTAMETPAVESLSDTWGSGPDDVYFVGYRRGALHYDGESFILEPRMAEATAITGSGAQDVLVAFDDGRMSRYDGRSLHDIEPPTAFRIVDMHTVSPRLTFALSEFSLVFRWNGRRWRTEAGVPAMSDSSDLGHSIWAADAQHVLVGTRQSCVFVRDRRGWRRTNPAPVTYSEVMTVWGSSANDRYAFGQGMLGFHLREADWVRVFGDEPEWEP